MSSIVPNANDEQPIDADLATELALATEPDPDSFATVVTGKHLWAARRGPKPGSLPAPFDGNSKRRPWLAQKPRLMRQLASYATLEDQTLAPRKQFFNAPRRGSANIFDQEPQDEPSQDSYEIEHAFGVAECMLCSGPKDSAAHGFVECTQAQAMWKSIMPTLRKMVNGRSVPTDTRSIVLGWPDLKVPTPLRARLILWRDAAIHLLMKRRNMAIGDGLKNDYRPRLDLTGLAVEHVALITKTISDAYSNCDPSKRAAFAKRWLDNGVFLRELNGHLTFHPMSSIPAATTATTASTYIPTRLSATA